MKNLAEKVLKGDRVAISKAISALENHDEGSIELLKDTYQNTGKAFVIGVTGPPGTGKSTLVDRIVQNYRAQGKKVAVLAIDPTSPISGGAVLGDRVRMLDHSLDSNVYIRSMASRGDEGGLSKATRNAVRILDAGGYDIVLVETVGIGQTELEIVSVADALLVVLMPEMGDEIQAFKAGVTEVGDIFAVNKSDLPGADVVIYNLDSVLASNEGWHQKAMKVSAKTGEGLDELMEALSNFQLRLVSSGDRTAKKSKRIAEELEENVSTAIIQNLKQKIESDNFFQDLVKKVYNRSIDPESASELLIQRFLKS